jgi:hypothetical protein
MRLAAEEQTMCIHKGVGLALLACMPLLSACYERPEAVFFEPGVYKGRTDPLLALEATPEQQQRLLKRLELVQTDR